MATITIRRSDLWPIGTTVGIYPHGAWRRNQSPPGPPTAAAIASAAVDAAGLLTVTDAGIASYTSYVAAAQVSGTWQYAMCRSTLDTFDGSGRAVGTGDTLINTTGLANVSASSGAFAIGQRITGPGIPAGTYLESGSGASWVMTDKATATASGVALEGHGAQPAVAGGKNGAGGATLIPVRQGTRWRAQVKQRRAAAGTS